MCPERPGRDPATGRPDQQTSSGRPSLGRSRRAFLGAALAGAATSGCLRLQEAEEPSPPGSTADDRGGDATVTTGAGRTLRLGMLLPLTGGLESFGQHMQDAAELPINQLTSADGGPTVDVEVGNTASQAESAVLAGEELVGAGYPAVVGPVLSTATLQTASEVFVPAEVVACSPSSSSPEITDLQDDDLLFRTMPSDALRGRATATAVAEHAGASSVAILETNRTLVQIAVDDVQQRFESLGGTVQSRTTYETPASDYGPVIEEALAGSPDVLVVAGIHPARKKLLGQLRTDVGSNVPVVLQWAIPDLASKVDYDVGDMRAVQYTASGPGREQFEELFAAEYDHPPRKFDASSYDATAVLLLASASAGENAGPPIRDALRDVANPGGAVVRPDSLVKGVALAASGDEVQYEGASGPVRFDENGDVPRFTYRFVRIQEGGTERIASVTAEH